MKKLLFELRMRKVSALRSVIICALFVIVGVSSIALMASFASANLEGSTNTNVTADTVFINDLESDYNYYMSLNYTQITNDSLPTHANRYTDSNLVRVFITYSGVDYRDSSLIGRVSPYGSDTQYELRYYKYYPKDNSGYIDIELIDNPFTSRPTGKGFQGWATDDANVRFYFSKEDYTRTARVYVGNNSTYTITFNAQWENANIVDGYSDIGNLPDYGMRQVGTKDVYGPVKTGEERRYYLRNDRTLYEEKPSVRLNRRVTGYVCNNNDFNTCVYKNNEECDIDNAGGRCIYYAPYTDEYRLEIDGILFDFIYNYNNNGTDIYRRGDAQFWDGNYYSNANNPTVVPIVQDQVIGQVLDMPDGASTVGLFYKTGMDWNNRNLYYDPNGTRCDQGGNCGGDVYRLIQPNEAANIRVAKTELPSNITQVDSWQINNTGWLYEWGVQLTNPANYYYMVTRDMNIARVNDNGHHYLYQYTSTTKPITITSHPDCGTNRCYIQSTSNELLILNADTNIENLRIYSNYTATVSDNVYRTRTISANRHNVKIGRNINSRNSGEFTFYGVIGTNSNNGTSSKFRVIVESGTYNYLLSNGYNVSGNNLSTATNTMQGTFIYGSDIDRAAGDNTRFIVAFCAYSSNWGGLSGPNNTTPSSLMIVKSGSFGKGVNGTTYDADYARGIYAGNRGNGYDSSLRSLIVEGGDINVINGGPSVDSGWYGRNVVSIYMKGGTVRSIFGGAGRSETGGNRIVSVSSGTVTNNVFGGSNSYQGSNGEGYLDGNTLVYIGGNATIGTSSTVLFGSGNNPTSPVPGDVFGAGNGRSGNNYTNLGVVNNSTVIINGGTINGSVYGGGNYGSVGLSSWSSTTNIQLLDGTINGSVYGGGNNAGGGQNRTYNAGDYTPPITVNITLDGAKVVEGIYGGSNTAGSLRGNVNINLLSNTADNPSTTNVYGGGRGRDTYVEGSTVVNANASNNGNLNLNEVYGGSAFGHVNTKDGATAKVTINGGTFASVYGGSEGSSSIQPESAGAITVTINGGIIGDVYGGNNKNGKPSKPITVDLIGGTITNAYGGGNASAVTSSKITLKGSTVTQDVFGGSNSSGDNATGEVHIESGSANRVFGGNNVGGSVGETVVYYLGANISDGVYGCGKGSGTSCTKTNVYINNEDTAMHNAYGGGYAASVTGGAWLLMLKGNIDNVFGGSNTAGTVQNSYVYISGGSPGNVYGGNNDGGRTVESHVNVGGSNLEYVYGGGRNAETTNTTVQVFGGYTKNLFGGGLNGGVSGKAKVTIFGGIVTKTFGGSNNNGTVTETEVLVDAQADSVVYNDEEEYNGEVQQEVINTDVTITFKLTEVEKIHWQEGCWDCTWFVNSEARDRISKAKMEVFITNNMTEPLETYKIYVAGTNVWIPDTFFRDPGGGRLNYFWHIIKQDDRGFYFDENYNEEVINGNWAGNNRTTQVIPADGQPHTTGGYFYVFSDDEDPSTLNQNLVTYTDAGNLEISYEYPDYEATTLIVRDIYGGNNAGGTAVTTSVTANNGYASYVYGGSKGTGATATNTNVQLTGGQIINVYGGGDEAVTTGNTNVVINNGIVENLFGGGNGSPATVKGNAYVLVNGGETMTNLYGGGNEATTEGNSTVSLIAGVINGSLFGGGNKAPTGTDARSAVSTVNILAGTVNGNVYGGANYSVIKGRTDINIGENTVSDPLLNGYTYPKTITINGTVYGGGESKEEGNTNYNFDFISVTQGIEIDVDAANYTMNFDGSIFGSGNASSSAGVSNITLKNVGTTNDIVDIESIQRATNVKIINSNIQIFGTKDSTNKYGNNKFTLNRIEHLYLLNNSSLYLREGANVLKEFNSGLIQNDEFVKESVTITELGITSQNVNNRLFMWPNKTLNVLKEEELNPNYAGNVNGMCFLGLYLPDGNTGHMKHGIYDTSLANNQTVNQETAELMIYSGTSVYGKHKEDHDITVDGYWSYYLDEDTNDKVTIDYVDTTPKNSTYYIWAIGVQFKSFEVELDASRYSTYGVKNLTLNGFETPNTILMVEQFLYDDFENGVTIVDKGQIKKVADSSSIANSKFALSMGTSDTGWKSRELTDFFTNNPSYSGSTVYETESSESPPILSFYLYNSKNIELREDEEQRELGYGRVIIKAITHDPEDPLTNYVVNVEVIVKIYLQRRLENGYGSVIAPGKKYSIFPHVTANIASTGSVSIYHNLFMDLDNVEDEQGKIWNRNTLYPNGAYRAITSEFVYPVGTTITMIDLTDNQYYYYTVTNENIVAKQNEFNNGNEVSYRLSDFIKMDSTSSGNHYNDSAANNRYYDSVNKTAYEEFIFTVDFSNANVTQPVTSKLYLELRDPNHNDSAIVGPLPSQGDDMKFSLYTNANTQLITTGTLSTDTLYVGESMTIDLDIEYRQAVQNGDILYDTAYDDYQLGAAITFYDSNGLQLDDQSLLGVVININGTNYYAQTDGTYRVNLAGKVANVSSTITIDTASSNMPSGVYTMRIDTFGSYDGLYSGELKNEPLIRQITILNNKYGLLVESSDEAITHDKNDGKDANGERTIDFIITTSSSQDNPNLRVRLERRTYDAYDDLSYEYESVNFDDIFEDELTVADATRKLYYVTQDLPENINFSLTVKEGPLKTGTYRIVFGIYDGDNYIGSVYRYLIIRDMK